MKIVFTFVLLLSALTVQGSESKGLIFGTVREALTGKEISGATVRLMIVNQMCPLKEVLSDEKGQFLFNDLSLGRYRVAVTKDGYARTVYGEASDHPVGQELLITGATSQHEIEFQLDGSAAISGHIYDSQGGSVPNSPVVLESIVDHRTFRTFTDSLGFFSLLDLPADFYKISARKYDSSKKQIEGERWYYPGTLDEDGIEAVELQTGKTAVIDIRFGIVPKHVWSGKVVGPDGEAVPGVDLAFLRLEDSKLSPLAACKTGEDGTCLVRSIAPGQYWVYLLHVPPPYAMWFVNDPAVRLIDAYTKRLLIEHGKQSSTEFHIERGVPVQAKIYMGSGAPAAMETGIKVTLTHFWQVSHFKLPFIAGSTHPTADTLEFYVHPALTYELEVNHQDPNADFSVVKVQWNRNPLSNPIQISQGSADQLEIWVDQGSTISGSAPGARVVFAERMNENSNDGNFYSPSLFNAIVQHGNFLLRALPPGTYRIRQDKKNAPFVEVTIAAGESKTVAFE